MFPRTFYPTPYFTRRYWPDPLPTPPNPRPTRPPNPQHPLTAPLLSLDAFGTLGKAITYTHKRGGPTTMTYTPNHSRATTLRTPHRNAWSHLASTWTNLPHDTRQLWLEQAHGHAANAYRTFLRQNLHLPADTITTLNIQLAPGNRNHLTLWAPLLALLPSYITVQFPPLLALFIPPGSYWRWFLTPEQTYNTPPTSGFTTGTADPTLPSFAIPTPPNPETYQVQLIYLEQVAPTETLAYTALPATITRP